MRNVLIAIAALCLCSCASAPRVAPRFTAPSTSGIEASNKKAIVSVTAAKAKSAKLGRAIDTGEDKASLQLQVASLTTDLDNALTSLDATESARNTLAGQLKAETDTANRLADYFDKDEQKIAKQNLFKKRMDSYAGLGAVVYGFERLLAHILIAAGVLIVFGLLVFLLKWVLPFLVPVWAFIIGMFSKLTGR